MDPKIGWYQAELNSSAFNTWNDILLTTHMYNNQSATTGGALSHAATSAALTSHPPHHPHPNGHLNSAGSLPAGLESLINKCIIEPSHGGDPLASLNDTLNRAPNNSQHLITSKSRTANKV